jgi:hypothetical protein
LGRNRDERGGSDRDRGEPGQEGEGGGGRRFDLKDLVDLHMQKVGMVNPLRAM